jgi:radical SAM protein with 4Fe4S-binding SPASM domain
MPFRKTSVADLSAQNLGFGIDITTHCNLECITCYYLDSPANQPAFGNSHISVELFERAMSEASSAGFQEIYILGGEPTIHPDILELLNCAARFHFKQVLLVTNGIRLADLQFCRAVEAAGSDIVVQRHVMDDGDSARQVQDTLVGRTGTLGQVNRAFANIESVFEPSRVAVQCCITRPVVESRQIYEVFRYAKTHCFEHVIECTKASARFSRGNRFDLTPVELFQVYDRLARIDIEEFGGESFPMTPQAYGKTCHMPENSVHCLVDGTIIPCVGQSFPLGNLFSEAHTSLEEILDSDLRKFFSYPHHRLHGHCRDCSHFVICTGGCRGDAFYLTGCFSASAIQCPQLAKYEKSLSLNDFIPSTCNHCALRKYAFCSPRKDVDDRLYNYLGPIYQPRRSI